MSFAESLENDLKNLERAAEQDTAAAARKQAVKEAGRGAVRAAQPYAEQLRTSPFTAELLNHAVILGHSRRIPVRVFWLGPSLRLEGRGHCMELTPTAEGVRGRFLQQSRELESFGVDFSGSAEELARNWLATIP